MNPKRLIAYPAVVAANLLSTNLSSAVTCDYSPLDLPEKNTATVFDNETVKLRYGLRFEFHSADGDSYTIRETSYGAIDDVPVAISHIIATEVGDLPNDACNLRVQLGSTDVTVESGQLVLSLPVNVEQAGCLVGVRGILASGTLDFKSVFQAAIEQKQFTLTPTTTQSGEILNNVPDVDATLTKQIDVAITNGTEGIIGAVDAAIKRVQAKLDEVQKDIDDPTRVLGKTYQPTISSIAFKMEGSTLKLIQVRTDEERPKFACTIRQQVEQNWNELSP
jgi:hypothetical protein